MRTSTFIGMAIVTLAELRADHTQQAQLPNALQPLCVRGCNPMRERLQPHVCSLQPHVCSLQPHVCSLQPHVSPTYLPGRSAARGH